MVAGGLEAVAGDERDGWHSFEKGDEELASMNYWNDHDWFFKLRRGQGPPSLPESCLSEW